MVESGLRDHQIVPDGCELFFEFPDGADELVVGSFLASRGGAHRYSLEFEGGQPGLQVRGLAERSFELDRQHLRGADQDRHDARDMLLDEQTIGQCR